MQKKRKGINAIPRMFPYFLRYKWIFLLDLFCAAITTACELIFPLIAQKITDLATNTPSALTIRFVLSIGLFYLLLRLIDAVANYYMTSIGHGMGTHIETDMRHDLFEKLLQLPHAYFDDTKVGQIMARMTSDLFEVTEFAHHCPEEFLIAFLKITLSFIILCRYNVWLTIITFAFLPLMLLYSIHFNKKMHHTMQQQRVQTGEINAQVEDSLLGIRVVKSFHNEAIESEKFSKNNLLFLNIKKKTYRYMAAFHSGTRIFDGLMYMSVLVAGALFIYHGKLEPSALVAYLLYVSTLLVSIKRIVEFTEQFQRGITGIERFWEIMDVPITIQDAPNALPLEHVIGDITFEDVSFSYTDQTGKVLSHLSFSIKAGSSVAFVGPSGSGKTTLCNLIPRFYDIDRGKIYIDHQDIHKLQLASLRENIGMVQQDVYLFSGSIAENILYGNPNASEEEIIDAAKKAGADEFIRQLPQGYDTYVGERGIKLSGGQKQRISIARVFLKNPPILILDEATSALDSESERIIQESLERLTQGRTTITIAHRLSTIQNADEIFVLTENGIAEHGTHEALLKQNGAYAQLYHAYAPTKLA